MKDAETWCCAQDGKAYLSSNPTEFILARGIFYGVYESEAFALARQRNLRLQNAIKSCSGKNDRMTSRSCA